MDARKKSVRAPKVSRPDYAPHLVAGRRTRVDPVASSHAAGCLGDRQSRKRTAWLVRSAGCAARPRSWNKIMIRDLL
jgi:hypothetical protein